MSIFGASINSSTVIAFETAEEIKNGSYYPVKLDANGKVKKCSTEGEAALGILIAQTADTVAVGDDVTVQVKDMGPAIAGGVIAAGDPVMVNGNGKLIKAVAGSAPVHVLGYAMQAAATDGDIIQIQIMKSMLAAAGAGA
ncbi:capsid cement protein [Eubacterium maltosivorans]|uniref:capsid cement protein n=1 Tax=Eubacterium maltosivorans TaxID=2041044 RepID=UPI0018A00438|nr:capsid cement protein [Eubacterium maltosivorans]